jgi:hypothetical protein
MSATVSRRENTIVAWHEVPGKAPSKAPSRRVRYDRAQLIPEEFLVEIVTRIIGSARTPAQSDRSLRDGSLGVGLSQALRASLRSHCPSGHFAILFWSAPAACNVDL